MSFTIEESHRLGEGRVFINTTWQRVLNHAAAILTRPIADAAEAYEILRRYTTGITCAIPQPDELHVWLIAHRLTF